MYICNHSAQEVEEGRQTFKTNMGKNRILSELTQVMELMKWLCG